MKHYTVKEVADEVGVHRDTISRWEKKGKLKSFRNPMNGYRMFTQEEVDRLKQKLNAKAQTT